MNGHLQRSVSPCLRNPVCGGEGQRQAADVLRGGGEGKGRGGSQGACCCGESSLIGYIPEPYGIEKFPNGGHLEYRLMFNGEKIAEHPTFEGCQEAYKAHAGEREVMEGGT